MKLRKPYVAFLLNWNKAKLSTDIIYFYIDTKRDSKNPLIKMRLQFVYEKTYLRVSRYSRLGLSSSVYIRPRVATEHLREARYLLVSDTDLPWNYKNFTEYCKTFKISKPKVAKVCWYCLMHRNTWTSLDDQSVKYKNFRICEFCSKKELQSELQKQNLVVSTGLTRFYEKQAQRTKNLDDVLDSITLGLELDPVKNPESTLYDIIPAKKQKVQVKISDVKGLPKRMRHLLIAEGFKTLLPIQEKAIKNGLFDDEPLLIVGGTTSGKTLVGELAGIKKALNGQKVIYLSPLVALTNQKYEQFRKRYRKLNIKTAIRVGMSRIEVEGEFNPIIDNDYKEAGIVVATYEAFDYLLRSEKSSELGNIGTIVIDEIQMLMSESRGFRLNGLIARLKSHFPNAQFIYLSATVGNPEELAKQLSAKCVKYLDRPVALELHTILTDTEDQRIRYLVDLCKAEEEIVSSTGFKGQTLVFTNSRRNCEKLAKKLKSEGVNASYYHAGLTFNKRKKVERGFEKGTISTVATTIALGVGVDFPASLVVFENLAMGISWLTVTEFHQILGRAGRLGYHDKGKVYLLIEPGRKIFAGQDATEEQIAFDLLTKPIEDVNPELDTLQEEEEVLATVVSHKIFNISRDKKVFANFIGKSTPISDVMRVLKKMKMIDVENKNIYATNLGKAVSQSFLAPSYALRLVQEIKRQIRIGYSDDFALTLAVRIQTFRSAHLSSKIQGEIERVLKTRISTNIFSGAIGDLYSGNGWGSKSPTKLIMVTFTIWSKHIFNCKCLDMPFCDCGEINFSKILIDYRMKGYSPTMISSAIRKSFNIQLYPGDIYSYLDAVVHHLEAIKRLARVLEQKELEKITLNIANYVEQPVKKKRVKK